MYDVATIFNSLEGTGLQQDDFHENMSMEEYWTKYQQLAKEDDKLKELMRIKETEDLVESITQIGRASCRERV